MNPLLAIGDLDLAELPEAADVRIARSDPGRGDVPVAIIGMSGRVGEAVDLEEFWQMTVRGERGRRDLSEERRADVDAYLAARGAPSRPSRERYWGGTRLPSVAEFDYPFFSMSRQEARALDPNQRIFLETAWAALEDAGHLNAEIRGQQVGVYVGMSTDFGDDYRTMIQAIAPDAPEISVAGNVKSIIGSRIAYLLNLRGPSMLIDTACSSGLVAAYTACRAIQRGDCTMALVGAVNCDLLPVVADSSGIGIKDIQGTSSRDGHTRTFDRRSDGTSPAEGCIVLVLKALDRAQRDGDTIRAVILGGAINQDGASNGITAPNAQAQADLIDSALADAGVRADQISFIEAHGTATRLGDPVEIGGIERAFARHTSRKQFCGIGTVKTNIGHMDNASGLAGLAKLVLSMRHRTLPASLGFDEPNPNIVFPLSPVYVNDRTVPWGDDRTETLYAGINSFGLSGTNCHLVVRSADPVPEPERVAAPAPVLLPLSAPDTAGLKRLVARYLAFLSANEVDLADLGFTASTGRLHHRARVAFVFEERQELLALLARHLEDGPGTAPNGDLTAGEFRLVVGGGEPRDPRDLTPEEQKRLSREAALLLDGTLARDGLRRLASLYVRGADIDWRAAARGERRIPLPTYPFEPLRCWIKADGPTPRGGPAAGAHLVRTLDRDIAVCRLSPHRFWELAEHRIDGLSVLPGTGLVEMIVQVARRLGHTGSAMTLRRVQFAAPLAVDDGAEAEVHVIIGAGAGPGTAEVTVAAQSTDGIWVRHATAELVTEIAAAAAGPIDPDGLRRRLTRELGYDDQLDRSKGLTLGERWTGSLRGGWADRELTEMLYELELPVRFRDEIDDYALHPALLDTLINAPSNLYDEDRLYLPLSYGRLTIHGPLPAHVLAHFRKRPASVEGRLYAFDVTVADPTGRVVLTVENYCIKSAVDLDLGGAGGYGYVQAYQLTDPPVDAGAGRGGTVLLCGGFGPMLATLTSEIRAAGYDFLHVADAADDQLGEGREFAFGILAGIPDDSVAPLAERVVEPVDRTVALVQFLAARRPELAGGLVVLTHTALAVTGEEPAPDPGQAGVLGLMRVAGLEHRALGIRCVDIDERTPPRVLIDEARGLDRPALLFYRDARPYEPVIERRGISMRDGTRGPVPPDGLTVVSGGTGGLGTAVAQDLARQGFRRIVLLGSEREGVAPGPGSGPEGDPAVTEVVRLDMADPRAVERAVVDLRERYGRISGVLHLAGRPGIGFLHTKSIDEFMAVYRPKAVGGVALHEATLGDDLDFFVAFSSISGLLLNQGQSDYTAANLVLDSLAQYRRARSLPALSIQWPAWRETGMAARLHAVDEDELFPPVGPSEGTGLLRALMAERDHPPVVMPGRRRAVTAAATARASRTTDAAGAPAVALYGLDGVGAVEQAVAEIWARTLDVTELDAHDKFDDLGGNSLLASQMLRHYDERFPDLMDITDLFRFTTIADQAACVASRLGAESTGAAGAPARATDMAGADDIDRLLDMVEQGEITVEESRGLL
ncbi:SDR family NAD(P)-dependent oxidoreductase [Crossiella sp. SN42]|uniref:type I polyketide synthase n=1 Tax=Crossiella sp. SN42 TaxID=2944808 RepID=UPI00207C17C7|nr:type I polyketide synthase [Crossiella sp. SN42]MCO1579139.1 SDR family NAD(P)-dependent oxidoreductase [Crossiella sp. SN42]